MRVSACLRPQTPGMQPPVIPAGRDELLTACAEYVERQTDLLYRRALRTGTDDVDIAMWAALDQLEAAIRRTRRQHSSSRPEPGE